MTNLVVKHFLICLSSIDGVKCYNCPVGATCEQIDETGVVNGVSIPSRNKGYYLTDSQASFLSSDCLDQSKWAQDDPCRTIQEPNITYIISKCSKLPNFDQYWSRQRIFACISGKSYYACDVRTVSKRKNIHCSFVFLFLDT